MNRTAEDIRRLLTPSAMIVLSLLFAACHTVRIPETDPLPTPPRTPAADHTEPDDPQPPKTKSGKPPFSLDDCIRTAQQQRLALRMAERRTLIQNRIARETRAGDWPSLDAEAQYRRRSNETAAFGAADRGVTNASLTLTVPVYDFGRTANAYMAERLRTRSARLDARRTRQNIEVEVKTAYFRLLEAQKIRAVVDESIRVLNAQLKIARNMLDQGLVARNDVLAAEVQLAERKQEQIRARNNIALARARLNRVMGREVTAPLSIVDVLEVDPWDGSPDTLFALAARERPDLAALQERLRAAVADRHAARAELAPDIVAFGAYERSTDDALANDSWFLGGLGVTWPIFTGGENRAILARRKLDIAQARDRRDNAAEEIFLAVHQAYLAVLEAGKQVPVARKRIALAEENLQVIQDRYEQGLVTQTDVLLEENRLTQARSSYFQSLYAYHLAVARLTHEIAAGLPGKTTPAEDTVP